jgi:hypothetical protein
MTTHTRTPRIRRIPKTVLAAAVVLIAGGFAPRDGGAAADAGGAFCSVHPSAEFSAWRTRRTVRTAEVVVRARAIGRVPAPPGHPRPDGHFMSFAVLEVLAGTPPSDTLVFMGAEDDRDSFREPGEDRVPYLMFHRWRGGGDCIAASYRPGAEYLLLLGRRGDEPELDPYWAMLSPTSEQIRGPRDPWVTWVRKTLAAAS